MKTNCRGQVLAQVLVMSMIMIFLASLMLRGAMQQVQMQSHANFRGGAVKSAEAALNAVHDAWAANGQDCTSSYPIAWANGTQVCCHPSCHNQNGNNCINNVSDPACTCQVSGNTTNSAGVVVPFTDTVVARWDTTNNVCKLSVQDNNTY